jgi:hypothetical protein
VGWVTSEKYLSRLGEGAEIRRLLLKKIEDYDLAEEKWSAGGEGGTQDNQKLTKIGCLSNKQM